jgi:hypothetical protein
MPSVDTVAEAQELIASQYVNPPIRLDDLPREKSGASSAA